MQLFTLNPDSYTIITFTCCLITILLPVWDFSF